MDLKQTQKKILHLPVISVQNINLIQKSFTQFFPQKFQNFFNIGIYIIQDFFLHKIIRSAQKNVHIYWTIQGQFCFLILKDFKRDFKHFFLILNFVVQYQQQRPIWILNQIHIENVNYMYVMIIYMQTLSSIIHVPSVSLRNLFTY